MRSALIWSLLLKTHANSSKVFYHAWSNHLCSCPKLLSHVIVEDPWTWNCRCFMLQQTPGVLLVYCLLFMFPSNSCLSPTTNIVLLLLQKDLKINSDSYSIAALETHKFSENLTKNAFNVMSICCSKSWLWKDYQTSIDKTFKRYTIWTWLLQKKRLLLYPQTDLSLPF